MSTTVQCASSVATPTDRMEIGRLVDYDDPALLFVHVFEGSRNTVVNPTRADFVAAAVVEGWETQARSRKPWPDVPEANKATMRAAVRALLIEAQVAHLAPFEDIALTVAAAQVRRGEEPTPNVAAVCVMALARLARGETA